MSRASISTGDILFNATNKVVKQKEAPKNDQSAMHIAILGDFSGRSSRGETDTTLLAKRKVIEIDRDNFDEVFSELNIKLLLPFSEAPIAFSDIDDLHPDYLVENVSLFEKFRILKRKLKNPDQFQTAVDEIQQWMPQKSAETKEEILDEPETMQENVLDTILSQSSYSTQDNSAGDIDQLIKGIIAPYMGEKADPRLPEMEAYVDNATSETLRKIMHASRFQELEANWRALYFLVRRLETSAKLKIFLLDVSREELVDDLINNSSLERSNIYSLLVEKYKVPGAIPFSLIQFNYQLEDDADDIRLASAMAIIAEDNNAVALSGASEKLAGCESLSNYEKTENWDYELEGDIAELWRTLREQSCSQHLALVAPKFLLRIPYGKKSSPIESFPFEELSEAFKHEYYLWGNSATLVTLLLAQSYKQLGWHFRAGQLNEVDDLPLHIYIDEDGDNVAKACGEIFITDTAVDKLANAGLLSVRSIKGKAGILVPNFRSFSATGKIIFS